MKKEILLSLLVILILGIIGVSVYYGGAGQSILSLSKVSVGEDGKAYWVYTASANKPNENFIFTATPTKFTEPDGTQVTPTQGITIVTSRSDGNCVYQTSKISRFIGADYYILRNPEKVINVTFADGNNNIKTIDGTVVQSVSFADPDGKGSVTIETQGYLSGKYNCPGYENVALIKQKDGTIKFYYKSDLESASAFDLTQLLIRSITGYPINTQFTSTMTSTPTFDGNRIVGQIPLGNVVFTITADQDYFDSLVYIPPKQTDPKIDSIETPSEITKDGTSSMIVKISNQNSNSGTIAISTESSVFSVQPSQTNAELSTTQISSSFTIKAPNAVKSGNIKVTACSVDQFSSTQNCDSKTVSIDVVSGGVNTFCGDNICQSNENFNTCSTDCKSQTTTEQQNECKWYQDNYTTKFLWFNSEGCRLSLWIVIVTVLTIVLLIVGGIIFVKRKI